VFVWLYTLVFVLAALWFTHYSLAALEDLRGMAVSLPAAPDSLSVQIPTSTSTSTPIALP
jgi:hypothetical protein